MNAPLTHLLSRIFVNGFYKAHAGMFLVGFLVIFGAVEPGQLLGYHLALMLALVSDPGMLAIVFAAWLLYTLKTVAYVTSQLSAPEHQFLRYSINAFPFGPHFRSWMASQFALLLPVTAYGLTAAVYGGVHHIWLGPLLIVFFLLLLSTLPALLYLRLTTALKDGSRDGWFIRWSANWKKPLFSLYLYHVMDRLKVQYLVTKLLSWGVITAVFALFADVSHDVRVACIALLAIGVSHSVLVVNQQVFETTRLGFLRNLPYTRSRLFVGYLCGYFLLLLPELVWVFGRFHPLMAIGLTVFLLSVVLLLHGLSYWLGPDPDRYLMWTGGLFVLLFWLIMFRAEAAVAGANFLVAFLLFYRNYYRSHDLADGATA